MPERYWPEDSFGLFDFTETFITQNAGLVGQLVPANPMRTGLIVSADTACYLELSNVATGARGILVGSALSTVLLLTTDQWGGLVGQQWWLNTVGAAGVAHVYAIEVLLNRHPQPGGRSSE